jgi:MFS family permease
VSREGLVTPADSATDYTPLTTHPRPKGAWSLVIALGIGVFVGGFDQTFVVPVLARIINDLAIPIGEFGRASWIINGYLLGYTVAMPLMGRLADVYGHLRVFVAGLLIFLAGSVLVALAPTLETLALARAVTALGGGALVPVALAIAADVLPPGRRPLGLSAISVSDDASSLLGPLWGTLIGVWIGWRGLFWMNIALGLPVLIAVLWMARGLPRRRNPAARVDWVGGLLLAAALAALTFALADAAAEPRPLRDTLLIYLLAGGFLLSFALWELRTAMPLIDLRMFRIPRLTAANALFFLEGGALITALVNVPLMTEVLWGEGGAQPGLMLMRMVLFMILGGVLGGLLAPRIGYRITAFAGFALTAAGLWGMRAWPIDPSAQQTWLALAIAGLGFTLADAPLYATVVESVEQGRRASATALLQVLQTTGMVLGMALLASQGLGRFDERAADLFRETALEGDPEQYRRIIHTTFDETFLAAALAMALGAVLCLFLGGRRARSPEPSVPSDTEPQPS